jgi:hypothetical protein
MQGLEESMGCCSTCCGPIQPRVEAMRKDPPGVRAVLYISAEASRNRSDWNCKEDPKVVDEFNSLHIFHESNTLPVLQSFDSGNAKDLWGGLNTPHFDDKYFGLVPNSLKSLRLESRSLDIFKGPLRPDMLYFSTIKEDNYRAVLWKAPKPIVEFNDVTDLVMGCVDRVGFCRYVPSFNQTIPGCKSCNDIMTQESTTAHFMVRNVIGSEHLVPLESILSVQLSGKAKDANLKFDAGDAKFRWDPSNSNKGGRAAAYTYQACLAYYIHRCMPPKDKVKNGVSKAMNELDVQKVHSILATLSFLFLQIGTLTFERYNGSQGGTVRNAKPDYRYRGCTEMYLSYVFWLLLCIDTVEAEYNPNKNSRNSKSKYCKMGFVYFHRYVFLDFIKVLILLPEYAQHVEIMDAVFDGNILKSGHSGNMVPGSPPAPPEERISHICQSIPVFYLKVVKPLFSRHLAGLEPDPYLLEPHDPVAEDTLEKNAIKHNNQRLVYNMLIDMTSVTNVGHLMQKVIKDEIDSYLEEVGVHAVFNRWLRMMEMAPKSTERLLQSYVDNQMLQEYSNIQLFMRPDSFQPTISSEAAETIYTMCNALELASEPSTKEELELLRIAPKCSEMKSIERLGKVGAFGRRNEMREPRDEDS